MDREIERLYQELDSKQGLNRRLEDDIWKELEELEESGSSDARWKDRLVWLLSGGDIVRGKEIYEKITLREALEWLLVAGEG